MQISIFVKHISILSLSEKNGILQVLVISKALSKEFFLTDLINTEFSTPNNNELVMYHQKDRYTQLKAKWGKMRPHIGFFTV